MAKEFDKDGVQIYQTDYEQEHLARLVQDLPEGDLIEVGVFMGASAKIIADHCPNRPLYLFDTFEGLPEFSVKDGDSERYYVGHCKAELEEVKENLKSYPQVVITKGKFPNTGGIIKNKKFAFAHIDVDIYQGTKESLEFIYPRVVSGGLILLHDYPAHNGVRKAVDDFMADKEEVEVLGGRQGLIRKK